VVGLGRFTYLHQLPNPVVRDLVQHYVNLHASHPLGSGFLLGMFRRFTNRLDVASDESPGVPALMPSARADPQAQDGLGSAVAHPKRFRIPLSEHRLLPPLPKTKISPEERARRVEMLNHIGR